MRRRIFWKVILPRKAIQSPANHILLLMLLPQRSVLKACTVHSTNPDPFIDFLLKVCVCVIWKPVYRYHFLWHYKYSHCITLFCVPPQPHITLLHYPLLSVESFTSWVKPPNGRNWTYAGRMKTSSSSFFFSYSSIFTFGEDLLYPQPSLSNLTPPTVS